MTPFEKLLFALDEFERTIQLPNYLGIGRLIYKQKVKSEILELFKEGQAAIARESEMLTEGGSAE